LSCEPLQLVQAAPNEELPQLLGALAQAQAVALARITAGRPPESARNLSAREASERLGVSVSWLHKNAARLPFALRIGRRLVFDSARLERWTRRQREERA
jgi:hypothetical protein